MLEPQKIWNRIRLRALLNERVLTWLTSCRQRSYSKGRFSFFVGSSFLFREKCPMCSRGAPKGREYVRYALLQKSYRSTAGQASQKSNECHVEMMRLGPFIGWGVRCWIRLDIGPTLVAHNRNLLHLRSRTGEPFSEVRTALVMLNMQGGEIGEAEAIAHLSLMRYFLFMSH